MLFYRVGLYVCYTRPVGYWYSYLISIDQHEYSFMTAEYFYSYLKQAFCFCFIENEKFK